MIGVQTIFSIQLYRAKEELNTNYDSEMERFRDLICKAKIIEDFTVEDYSMLSSHDLEVIARTILEEREVGEDSENSVFSFVFLEMDQIIRESNESIVRLMKPMQDNLDAAIRPILETNKRIRKILDPIMKRIQVVSAQWTETVDHFLEKYSEYLSVKEQATLIASKHDWFFAYEYNVEIGFYERLIELNKTATDNREIDDFFVEYYGVNIEKDIRRELKDAYEFKKYDEILSQIEIGYGKKLFYLVIPILFALIEGMIARAFEHNGRMDGNQLEKYISELLDGDETESLQEVINKRMFVSFEHGKDIISPISRHAILHGADINFGTEAVALRLLIILYNIAYSIGLREVNKE